MTVDAEFIRNLAGLSRAELPEEVIASLRIVDIVTEASTALAASNPLLTPVQLLYYQGYKAIAILGPSLRVSIPQSIKDNFNEFSRFNDPSAIDDLLANAKLNIEALERPELKSVNLFSVKKPEKDIVTEEVR